MFINKPVCQITEQLFSQHYILYVVTAVFLIIFIFFVIKTTRPIKKSIEKFTVSAGLFLAIFIIWFITSALIIVNLGMIDDSPPSASYHPLNAMIKYRCYQDHKYCPVTAGGVRNIAPDYIESTLHNAQITYSFNQKNQNYTLIIRNNNYHFNNDRVAIFDPRLAKVKGYGYGYGLDFFDADIVANCDGTFRITNPPPFAGPWDNIK